MRFNFKPLMGGIAIFAFLLQIVNGQVQTPRFMANYGESSSYDDGQSVSVDSNGSIFHYGFSNEDASMGYNGIIAKTTTGGDLLWAYGYGTTNSEYFYDGKVTSNQGHIAVGKIYNSTHNWDIYLVRTNAAGQLSWAKSYWRGDVDAGYWVEETSDGGFLVAGETTYGTTPIKQGIVFKTNSFGAVTWKTITGGTSADFFTCVKEASNGDIYAVGSALSTSTGGSDIWLAKLNSSGTVQWEKSIGGTLAEEANELVICGDSLYIVGSTRSYGAGGVDTYVINTDLSGNVKWAKAFGGTGTDVAYSVQCTDSGIVVAGNTNSFGYGADDGFMMFLGLSGNLQSFRTYGGTYSDGFQRIRAASSKSWVTTGTSYTYHLGSGDFWGVRTSGSGDAPCNDSLATPADSSDSSVLNWTVTTNAIKWNTDSLEISIDTLFEDSIICRDTVSLRLATHIHEKTESPIFDAWPNPSNSQLHVRAEGVLDGEIRLLNMVGQVMLTATLDGSKSDCVFNVSSLPAGVYFVRFSSGEATQVKRIVISH